MKEIKLSQGKVAIVDDIDYEWLSQYNWFFDRYAYRTIRVNHKRRSQRMHRLILEKIHGEIPKGMVADHINRKPLDNRRENLRITTYSVNVRNQSGRGKKWDAPSGVYWDNQRKKWKVMACIDYHKKQVGRYNTLPAAHRAYKVFMANHGIVIS